MRLPGFVVGGIAHFWAFGVFLDVGDVWYGWAFGVFLDVGDVWYGLGKRINKPAAFLFPIG